MATKNLNARICWKKDTAANWTTKNPVLLNGEIVIVVTASGEERFKIGDGTSAFTALPFQDEAVRNLISAMMPKTGGAFTGTVTATANQTKSVGMIRNIFVVDGTPENSMGEDGDICFAL